MKQKIKQIGLGQGRFLFLELKRAMICGMDFLW